MCYEFTASRNLPSSARNHACCRDLQGMAAAAAAREAAKRKREAEAAAPAPAKKRALPTASKAIRHEFQLPKDFDAAAVQHDPALHGVTWLKQVDDGNSWLARLSSKASDRRSPLANAWDLSSLFHCCVQATWTSPSGLAPWQNSTPSHWTLFRPQLLPAWYEFEYMAGCIFNHLPGGLTSCLTDELARFAFAHMAA